MRLSPGGVLNVGRGSVDLAVRIGRQLGTSEDGFRFQEKPSSFRFTSRGQVWSFVLAASRSYYQGARQRSLLLPLFLELVAELTFCQASLVNLRQLDNLHLEDASATAAEDKASPCQVDTRKYNALCTYFASCV